MSATSIVPTVDLPAFITRWAGSGASERANYQLFLSELCDFLGVPRPNPSVTDVTRNVYVFERDVKFQNTDGTTSDGRIDLYKQGCFVLEAKQGATAENGDAEPVLSSTPPRRKKGHGVRGSKGWDDAMIRARSQAAMYARALHENDEGWPPFLIVVDVGHSIELYADFTRSGKTYLQHPDPKSFRILLPDLVKEENRELLRTVWTDPQSLDPTRRAAKVTRELADRLARLAKLLEKSKFEPGRGDCRSCAVDRLSAMAHADAASGRYLRTDHPEIPQHRLPGRRAGVGPGGRGAGRPRETRGAVGRPQLDATQS